MSDFLSARWRSTLVPGMISSLGCLRRPGIGGISRASRRRGSWCKVASGLSGIKDTDSGTANTFNSFSIPIGIGIDRAVTERLSLTADLLLNFTSLGETVRVGGRDFDLHTNVMPAFYVGIRF